MGVKQLSDKNTDGCCYGVTSADKIGFYGTTPISQRSLAAQATSLISSSSDFTTAHLNALVEVMNTMAALGMWKGSV